MVPLTVKAIVVDPQFSAPFNLQKRLWVGPGELPAMVGLSSLGSVSVGVRYRDPGDEQPVWNSFLESLGGSFQGQRMEYQGLILGYTAPYALMAVMLVVFSVLSVLIALFAIHGTITSSILSDFRTIGVLRAQGFTPGDVRNVYRLQYMAIALGCDPGGSFDRCPLGAKGGFASVVGHRSLERRRFALGLGGPDQRFVCDSDLVLRGVGRAACCADQAKRCDPATEPRSSHPKANPRSADGLATLWCVGNDRSPSCVAAAPPCGVPGVVDSLCHPDRVSCREPRSFACTWETKPGVAWV